MIWYQNEEYINENNVTGTKTSAQLFFNNLSEEKLQIKVGLSSVSVKNALDNISKNKEDFITVKNKASETGIKHYQN